jgi:hypothetical protein
LVSFETDSLCFIALVRVAVDVSEETKFLDFEILITLLDKILVLVICQDG